MTTKTRGSTTSTTTACAGVLLFLVAACADLGPVAHRLSGEWNFSELLILGPEDECLGGGNVVFSLSDTVVSGTATRYSGCPQYTAHGAFTPAGSLRDSTLSFVIGECTHTATIRSAATDSISGTLSCTTTAIVGTWWAVRVGPVGALQMTPLPGLVVPGGSAFLGATVYDAASHALYGRTVTFASSNPTAATVTTTSGTGATVNAVGTGTTTITATIARLRVEAGVVVKTPVFASVSLASFVSCARAGTGEAWCWGQGPLGDGAGSSATPSGAMGGLTFTAVANGSNACGLVTSGAVYCWGSYGGYAGATPTPVPGTTPFVKLADPNADHWCALAATGAALCWGNNDLGQLGNPSSGPQVTPIVVQGGHIFSDITVSYANNCGLTAQGAAWCWGTNLAGSLGTGDTVWSTVPRLVSGGLTFTSVAAGDYHACGIAGGAAYCWGRNSEGQLGLGSMDNNDHTTPAAVMGGHTFASVRAAFGISCALTPQGAAWCWGQNGFGQLGNNDTTASDVPVPVSGGLTFAALSVSPWYACGVTSQSVVYCWGNNDYGQLGDGTHAGRLTPVRVLGQP